MIVVSNFFDSRHGNWKMGRGEAYNPGTFVPDDTTP